MTRNLKTLKGRLQGARIRLAYCKKMGLTEEAKKYEMIVSGLRWDITDVLGNHY